LGHTDASLALEVYAKEMERKRDTGERMDALLRGVDYQGLPGTSASEAIDPASTLATKNPVSGAF
jgi:hypothetical protein